MSNKSDTCPHCGADHTVTESGCRDDFGVFRNSACYQREIADLRGQLAQAKALLAAAREVMDAAADTLEEFDGMTWTGPNVPNYSERREELTAMMRRIDDAPPTAKEGQP